MTPELFIKNALIPALQLLPAKMDSPAARAQMIAITMQESKLKFRKQVNGPAKSYFQFESGGGVHGVLSHGASKPLILPVLALLDYTSTATACHKGIEDNDILACVFARLLLWTHPKPLPVKDDAPGAWQYYLDTWRPGKPRRESWDGYYHLAWTLV